MAVHFRVRTTDSMPVRLQVNQEIELRKKQQAEADQKAKADKSDESAAA